MIIKDIYGIERNTEKIFGVEIRYFYKDHWTSWSLWKNYKTKESMFQALECLRKRSIGAGCFQKSEFRPCHVNYDLTKEDLLFNRRQYPIKIVKYKEPKISFLTKIVRVFFKLFSNS